MSLDHRAITTAHSRAQDAATIIDELCSGLAAHEPAVVLFFCAHTLDGAAIAKGLRARLPSAQVLGCTTAGEYSDAVYGQGGTAAMALPKAKVRRSAVALAEFGDDLEASVRDACDALAKELGESGSLRELDPKTHVGLVLIDGTTEREEDVNEALGNVAPFLSFVGGSAGDNIAFERTQVFCNEHSSERGAALMVLEFEADVPFRVVKSCHFAATQDSVEITKVSGNGRLVLELNGRPAREVYAELIGVPAGKLTQSDCFPRPLGLMIDGKPWLRSVLVLPEEEPEGLRFVCRMVEGATLQIMKPLDLLTDTTQDLDAAAADMGCEIAGAINFDCAFRRIEIAQSEIVDAYHAAISRQPVIGFHTHGESWLGHINQTLTCLVIG